MALAVAVSSQPASAQRSVARAVLFFSPTCPHCQRVINQDLPVFFDTFGGSPRLLVDQQLPPEDREFFLLTNGQLEILLVNASRRRGNELYTASLNRIPGDGGVPRLVFGDTVLIGDLDIPQRFPGLVRAALEAGGMDWPPLVGLADHLARLSQAQPTGADVHGGAPTSAAPDTTRATVDSAHVPEPAASPETTQVVVDSARRPEPTVLPDTTPTSEDAGAPTATGLGPTGIPGLEAVSREDNASAWAKYGRDPVGSTLALAVLCGMVALMLWTPLGVRREQPTALDWPVLALALAGIGVACYLTYIEATGTAAVCGPVGDCNTVQQSRYATVFGVPVAAMGLVGYIGIVLAWGLARFRTGVVAEWAKIGMFAITLLGTLFSIYLTFLEPFVIGATCAWCLSSAVLIAALHVYAVRSVGSAWSRLRDPGASE